MGLFITIRWIVTEMWKNRVASCLNRKYNTITTRHYSYRKSTNQKHKGQHDFILIHPSSSHDNLQAKKKMIQAELNTLTVLLLYRLLLCVVNTPTLHKCQGSGTTTGINATCSWYATTTIWSGTLSTMHGLSMGLVKLPQGQIRARSIWCALCSCLVITNNIL